MILLPRAFVWNRVDTTGAEHVILDDRDGLTARGVQISVDPVPYRCHYELSTDGSWTTARFEATAEGAGWRRTLRVERATGRWRVTTGEQGDLDAALRAAGRATAPLPGIEDPDRLADAYDVDLWASPLTNTLPLRRVGAAEFTMTAALVMLPSLAVVVSEQRYSRVEGGRVRFTSGDFTAEIEVDDHGFVTHYPGLATRG